MANVGWALPTVPHRIARTWWAWSTLLLLPLALTGCEWLRLSPHGTSPLQPLTLATDGAELEITFIRIPLGDADVNGPMWNEIDEQIIPAELRAELAANGLRAGIIGSDKPPALEKKLAQADTPATPAAAAAKINTEPAVRHWSMQIRRGQPGNIIASSVYDQLSLLTNDDGQVRGQTYPKAQGEFVVGVDPQPDSCVKLNLQPQFLYGEPRQQWVGEDGMFHLQSGKPKKTYSKLKLEVTLRPDQTLIIASLPQRPGSVGHYLLTEPKAEGIDQKLMLIRLGDTKFNDLLVNVSDSDTKDAGQTVAPIEPRTK